MKRKSKKLTGKIATVKNYKLNMDKKGVHMVYIRKDNGKTVDVNVFTSLEDKKKKGFVFRNKALKRVRSGLIYPIPYKNTFFDHWTGVELVKVEKINKKDLNVKRNRILSDKDKMIISILGNKKGDK